MTSISLDSEMRIAPAPPGGALIAGQWRQEPLDLPVRDPATELPVGTVHRCTPGDVDQAVRAAATSMQDDWPLHERVDVLRRCGDRVLAEIDVFTETIAAEGVKTIREARAEVLRCVETLHVAAGAADVLTGETLQLDASPRGGNRIGWFTREPLGVVGAISSFNDPLNLVAHKVAPALLAGAGIVVKPSEFTPLSALHLARVLLACGVPPERLSVVCGGAEVGNALVAHPEVAVVSFTGGVRTAEAITRGAGVKKMLMELGGNNATIVCADADVDLAARKIVDGAFGVAGQNCLSVQRVYAETSVFEAVLRSVADGAAALVVGSKYDHATDIGPLINAAAAERVTALVDDAIAGGARLVAGGSRDGTYVAPTVLTGVPTACAISRDEIFGPVVVIEPVSSLDEALQRAGECEFALQAGIFTASLDSATKAARTLTVGAVLVNETSDFRIDSMPFGGFRQSGIGREGVRSAAVEMTAPRCVLMTVPSEPGRASNSSKGLAGQ
ncbi:aldehyde dehydrogenase family protein [Rudaeicoccus suwonensis]|uniref:Glyceraldehyde-3-phosphate dehydrogenase (NADP+) n=1 Tax=Rudaeicoccus suwonensis TaxID=657409 RepID=A0A561E3R6_9MICO|nr:aldehyde dehydrogenase family protein [Rudaeicoccus suwonensis]TWE10257.1 glyceraldehyde-3-phosphate dehydrogenase (NADP+) [Rudaeicoccus suwonensis]